MIMAFTVNTTAGLVFAVVIPILSVIIFGIMLYSIPLYRKVQNSLDMVLLKTRENLIGVRVIRAFCKEEGEILDFDASNKNLTAIQKFVGKISALLNPLTFFIINAGVIALIYVGALKVDSGILSQGEVVALYNYMSMILVELIKLASFIITVMKGVACGRRVQAVLDIPESENETEPSETKGTALLEFKNVSFCYEKASENSLSNISLSLSEGETLGVIGSTGSGKTTLINLIPKFYEATDGEVLFGGENVKSIPCDKLRSQIGVVPQKAVLFNGTIKDNLLWGNDSATDEELVSALNTAQIGNMELTREVSEGGKNFSGGQRQRLTIARALVRKPKLLILDDSTCALDYATDAALRAEIKKLDFSPAVVIVSQRTSSIAHADKILVLEDGKAVGFGTHDELLETSDVYKEIHTSQFKKEGE
jgi:ABC-type multidrug transport system fused ATPase/permease subunit